MNPKLLIALALSGHLMPVSPFLCSADDGGDGGGGGTGGNAGGNQAAKSYSQAEVDAIVGARLAREKTGTQKAVADAVAAEAAKRVELEQQLADLTAKFEDAGKTGAEKVQAEAARAAAAAKTKLDSASAEIAALRKATEEKDAALARALHAHRTDLFKVELQREFLAAKALPSAVADAVDLLVLKGGLEFNDDGKATLKLGEQVFDKPAEAVKSFLAQHPFLASHPGGGNGTRNTGSGALDPASLEGLSSGELLRRGLAARARAQGLVDDEQDLPGA